jgi:Tfp pilus assembly protein PilX
VNEAQAGVQQASQHLADAHTAVTRAEAAIADANGSLSDLQADQLALTNQLRSKRRQARLLSVAAYMSGGTESSIELVADTKQATDLLWRQTMLSEQSLDTRKVAREFQQLRNGTSAQVDHLVDRLDRLDQRGAGAGPRPDRADRRPRGGRPG